MALKVGFVYATYESYAIELLSAHLKQAGHQVKLYFDPNLFNDEYLHFKRLSRIISFRKGLIQQILEDRPDVLAFSLVTDMVPWFMDFAKDLRKNKVDAFFLAGGIHITSSPMETLQTNLLDAIIIGEGDDAFLELLDDLERGKLNPQMANLGLKVNSSFKVNPPRPLIQDLDRIPFPDKSLYEETFYQPNDIYKTMASRGCIYQCSFCNSSLIHRLYQEERKIHRTRTVDNVIQELKQAKEKYRFKVVDFLDEIFAINNVWLEEFAERYPQEIGIPFFCSLHPNFVSEKRVKLLEKAGCIKVDMGVQSLSDRIRKEICLRNEKKEQVKKAIRLLTESKMICTAEHIINMPTETEEDLLEMAYYYNNNRTDQAHFLWLRLFPRTPIVEIARQHNLITDEDIEQINRGYGSNAFTRGGTKPSKIAHQFMIVYILINLLPPSWINFLLDRRLYRYFPLIGIRPFAFTILRLANRQKKLIETNMYRLMRSYLFYLKKYFSEKIRSSLSKMRIAFGF